MKKTIAAIILAGFINFTGIPALADIDMNQTPVQTQQARIEHSHYKKSPIRSVSISEETITIKAGNVIKIAFADNFSTKTAQAGDPVSFVLNEDFKTTEDTILLPAGTMINGEVTEVIPTRYWNRNAQAFIKLNEIILPTGQRGDISARVYSKNSALKKSTWAAFGKAAGYTVGLFGIGAGIGAIIGAIVGEVGIACLAIGMPVGGGVGLITGSVFKGLNYNAKAGKEIKIQLNEDFDITLKKDELNAI